MRERDRRFSAKALENIRSIEYLMWYVDALPISFVRISGYHFALATEIFTTEYSLSLIESSVRRIAQVFPLPAPQKKHKQHQRPSRTPCPKEGVLAQADASQFDRLNTIRACIVTASSIIQRAKF